MHKTEFESVILLEPFKRYSYCLKRIADRELMFTLFSEEGNIAISSLEDELLLPLWSAPEFATLSLVDAWSNFQVTEISLEWFENEFIEVINKRNYLLNVFPIDRRTGFVVSLEEFIRDLGYYLQAYEE